MERGSRVLKQRANDHLDDDVLGLILERIGSHVSLILAASTCKRWRRIIADAAFLRRFRFLHGTTVAGNYHNQQPAHPQFIKDGAKARERNSPVFVLSPSLSIDGSHQSLDFLPGGADKWAIADSRGGLLLMGRVNPNATSYIDCSNTNIVLCEPLTRRYKKIPPPPVSSSTDRYIKGCYLVDGDADEAGGRIGMSNFRVFFDVCHSGDRIPHAVAIFAAIVDASGRVSPSWSEKTMDHVIPKSFRRSDYRETHENPGRVLGSVAGSRYIYLKGGTLVALDCSTGEFSSSPLPPAKYYWDLQSWPFSFHAVEGHDGEPRIITLFFNDIRVYARMHGNNWELEKSIQLAEVNCGVSGYQPLRHNGNQTLKLLTRGPTGLVILFLHPRCGGVQCSFTLNLETMEVAPTQNDGMGSVVYQCELPWPPAFHACLDMNT